MACFRTYLLNSIQQVAYGGLDRSDYLALVPNNSYINVEDHMDISDFSTAKRLADYLKVVANDKQLFNSYLNWKNSYCYVNTHDQYFCDVCKRLNENPNGKTLRHKLESEGRDFFQWWFNRNCRSRKEKRNVIIKDTSSCISGVGKGGSSQNTPLGFENFQNTPLGFLKIGKLPPIFLPWSPLRIFPPSSEP